MPAYPQAHMQNFMRLVRVANPGFSQRSSLQPLINVLNDNNGTGVQVCQRIAAIPIDKTRRYIDALYYLLATYALLPANAASNLRLGNLEKTNAARYTQSVMPVNYQPAGPQAGRVFVRPVSAFQNLTVEQFVLNNHANTGVLLIHLTGAMAGSGLQFSGRSTLRHMNSVLRVARLRGCPVAVLTMTANEDVCGELRAEFNQFPNRTRIFEPHHHMGSNHQAYRDFATNLTNVVVMGFDACVCVFANVFGANETNPNGTFRRPLSTLTNVVMSRAALVTNGTISTIASPSMGQQEYGPLFNT